jgi:hypothetical protein
MNSKTMRELLFAILSLGEHDSHTRTNDRTQQPAYAANIDEDGLGILLRDLDIPPDEEDK